MSQFNAVNALGVCSISTIVKRPDSKDSVFCTIRDLANIANEAAILAVRHDHEAVNMADFEAAIDRVIAGPEKKHRVMNAEEKRRVAFHESGHALVALTVPTGEPVHKVSIIPRGVAALGYTLQLPVAEKFLSTES